MNNKQLVTIASASLIVVGSILAVIWTTPAELFVSIGLVVSGIILFLLYTTISVAGWADNLVSGDKTEISYSLDPEQDVKSDEKIRVVKSYEKNVVAKLESKFFKQQCVILNCTKDNPILSTSFHKLYPYVVICNCDPTCLSAMKTIVHRSTGFR